VKKGFAALGLVLIVIAVIVVALLVASKKPLPVKLASNTSPVQNSIIEGKLVAAKDSPRSDLEKYLIVEASLLGVSDSISLYFKDFKTSNEVSIDPTRSWIPASTIKSFVVPEAFRQRRLGLINFSDNVTISAKNVVPTELETDEFPRLREGVVVNIGQLVEAMIEQSDNTAYNTLLDVLDRRNINLTLKNLGITETVVGEKLNLDDGQLAMDLETPGRQPVTTTAKDLADLFGLMYQNKIPNSDEMLNIFKKQKINNMIPALLPNNLIVAHKTGDWSPIFHDAGIIYKENRPFVLSVFTNSNDPSVVSKIAKVAYYQDAKSVGQNAAKVEKNPRNSIATNRPTYYLAQADLSSNVLAAQSEEKVPKITAADLGITSNDLTTVVAPSAQVRRAIISPKSPLYFIKKFDEFLILKLARTPEQKLNAQIKLSQKRLAEFENEILSGNTAVAQDLLKQSDQNLKQAAQETGTEGVNGKNLLKIKQENDLNFKTLANVAKDLPDDKKEEFVNIAYAYIKNNEREIKPVINKSLATNQSTSQEPIIGTVARVTDNSVTVKFEDGGTKEVIISDLVPERDFNSKSQDKNSKLKVESKVAIIGQTTTDGKIIPQFILRNVPKNIPDKHQGKVIEVNPDNSSLKIVTPQGAQEEVKTDEQTQIKSKDTSVSIEGIKPGSQVTVFGTGGTGGTKDNQPGSTSSTNKSTQNQTTKSDAVNTIQAKTVTVTKNDSGAKESTKKTEAPKPSDNKPKEQPPLQPAKPTTDSNKPEPQKPETKKPEKK